MKILFFSQDIGPSRNLARIAVEAVDRGHTVKSVFFSSASLLQIAFVAKKFDVLVISSGTLHADHDAEIIKKLKEGGSKIAIFSDTYDACLREPILKVAHLCDFAFVSDEFEQKKAQKAGFKNIVICGVPLWEDFCKPSRYTNDDIRMTLGIKSNERVVLFSGIKKGKITKRALDELVFAMLQFDLPWMLLPRFHPGDEYFKDGYYDSLLRSISLNWKFSDNLFSNISDLLPAADLVISLFSTVGIEAVYKRKRVIDYLPPYACDRLEELTGERVWNPAEFGATLKADSKESLVEAVKHLFTDGGFSKLRKNQEKFYPLLQSGDSVRKILETLENSVK